jgi:hypothetical protein
MQFAIRQSPTSVRKQRKSDDFAKKEKKNEKIPSKFTKYKIHNTQGLYCSACWLCTLQHSKFGG